MPALTYDDDNQEVRFNPKYLADQEQERSASVVKFNWKTGIKRGAEIKEGDQLATLQWSVGPSENVMVPEGCNGVIQKVNRNIDYVALTDRPAQYALILA